MLLYSNVISITLETVDKVYSYTKIHDISSPTQFRPPRPGGVAFPFRKDELGDCHPLKPLYHNTFGVWGAAPIGFPEGSRREKYAGGIFLGGIASSSEHY